MDRKRLFSILLVVFIDLLGFSLILPLLERVGTWSPGAFGAIVMIGVTIYVLVNIYNHPFLLVMKQEYAQVPVRVSD